MDDYLSKPFEPKELLLRINSILKRTQKTSDTPENLSFGTCQYDVKKSMLTCDGEHIHLTTTEVELLNILAQYLNQPLSRDDLSILSQKISNARAIDVQVTRLRKKIEKDPKKSAISTDSQKQGIHAYRGLIKKCKKN